METFPQLSLSIHHTNGQKYQQADIKYSKYSDIVILERKLDILLRGSLVTMRVVIVTKDVLLLSAAVGAEVREYKS